MSAPFFICEYEERRIAYKIGCMCVVFTLLGVGIFFGACHWARSQARGMLITAPDLEEVDAPQP